MLPHALYVGTPVGMPPTLITYEGVGVMGTERKRAGTTGQATGFDATEAEVSTSIAAALALLRQCVHDTGWTLEALESAMRMNKSLIWRVLNGDRALTLRFLVKLPKDVEALFNQRRAEGSGLLCVAPPENEHQAMRNLMSGIYGVLSRQSEKLRMARMGLPEQP
jgi:hypothetical protein